MAKLTVNGVDRDLRADAGRSLLSVLREDLGLLGAKYGCGEGECGACMVLVDGAAVPSCRWTVGEVAGRKVTTVEGLATGDALHPVQRAFLDEGALQCGFCTPGMIVAAVGLLARTPQPTRDKICMGMNRNLCRCCAYPRIIRAIQRAAGCVEAPKP